TGSVAFMFDRLGQIVYPAKVGSVDKVMEAAIEAGAEDVESDEEGHTIFTAYESFAEVAAALEASLGEAKSTKIIWRAKGGTPISGDPVGTLMKLLDALEDDDDVQSVYGDYEISDEDMEKFG
ncbi:MAG: YebC/PmpR family DNA-binding transcriptional regulator, partial [Phenylobacterium sp.]|nr:YebC/PmpR family DNA-binding transcriptional regulator [Phenylobacterium sp.]